MEGREFLQSMPLSSELKTIHDFLNLLSLDQRCLGVGAESFEFLKTQCNLTEIELTAVNHAGI
jgi:hypothetical protein